MMSPCLCFLDTGTFFFSSAKLGMGVFEVNLMTRSTKPLLSCLETGLGGFELKDMLTLREAQNVMGP